MDEVRVGLGRDARSFPAYAAEAGGGRRVAIDPREEDALLVRAGRGDRAAFSSLAARLAPRLMASAYRILQDRSAAEEIVQETFARAWREAPKFRPPEGGRPGAAAWMARIAVNLAIDQTRRPRHRPLDEAPDRPDPSADAEARLLEAERRARVRAAVAGLPPRQRAALTLAYDQELTNAAGAEALGVSVGAFELLLVRARRALRIAVSDAAPEGSRS